MRPDASGCVLKSWVDALWMRPGEHVRNYYRIVIEIDVCFLDHFVHTYTYLGGVTVLVSTSCMAMWSRSWTFLACLAAYQISS